MQLGQELLLEQIKDQTPNPLTQWQLFSQVSGLYDPVGLVTPAKQKGAMLLRKTFQETNEAGGPGLGISPPMITTIFISRCLRQVHNILQDQSHPAHQLFQDFFVI